MRRKGGNYGNLNEEDAVQMRLWRGASKWVALWLLLSVLTLLQAGALIAALYDVPIAKVSPSFEHPTSLQR